MLWSLKGRVRFFRCALLASLCVAPRPVASQATWRMETTPTVRIGASESPDASLAAPAGATRLPSGNIVVGDLGEWAIREFSPDGKMVKRYGRKGKGPGEVTYLAPLLRCGDTLVAHDIGGMSSVFTLDGKFVRAFRFKVTPYRVACNNRMQFLVMGWEKDGDMKASVYRPIVPYMLSRADSSAPKVLANLSGPERIGPRPYPLGLDPRIAIGAARAYVALSDSLEIHTFDMNGTRQPSLLDKVPRTSATAADLDAEKEREVTMMGERARKSIDASYAKMPLTKFLPGSRDIIIDREENVWVQHFPRAASKSVLWTVFGANGKVRARVEMPTAFELYEVGRDYVLGRYIDADEAVPEVRLYKLTRN